MQTDWLIDGFLPEGSIGLLIGKAGRGKSWVAEQAAVDVATGNKFLGEFDCKQRSVILIDEDTPTQRVNDRLERLCEWYDVKVEDIPLRLFSMTGFRFSNRVDFDSLKQKVSTLDKPFVILDSLTIIAGRWGVNKTEDASRVATAWKEIVSCGATLLVLHHISQKSDEDTEYYKNGDITHLAMGNTQLAATCDTAYAIWQVSNKPTIFAIRCQPRRYVLKVPEVFSVKLHEGEHEGKSHAFVWYGDCLPCAPTNSAKIISKLFFVNRDASFTVKQIQEKTGEVLAINDLRKSLDELSREKIIKLGRGAHNLYKYILNPDIKTMATEYARILREENSCLVPSD